MEKLFLVTGANSGLGKASALLLAKMKRRVILLCRNKQKGETALKEIIERSGNENIELMVCDLSSQKSIQEFAKSFKNKYNRLNVLLNCAGISVLRRQVSEDGLELMFGTEFLGHFLLTNLLVNELIAGAPSRVITRDKKMVRVK